MRERVLIGLALLGIVCLTWVAWMSLNKIIDFSIPYGRTVEGHHRVVRLPSTAAPHGELSESPYVIDDDGDIDD